MDRKKLIRILAFLICLILVVNFFATKFYWYYSIWYFDMIMHALGGFSLGLAFIYIFQPPNISHDSFLKILVFVLLIGIGWEVFEIIFNDVIAQNLFNYLDTFSDIFFDLAGGTLAILFYLKRIMLQLKDGPWEDSLKDRP